MKLSRVLRRKAFPLILTYSIASILYVCMFGGLTVPIATGTPDPDPVTFSIANVTEGYYSEYGEIYCDVWIDAPGNCAIVGWTLGIQVNPDVLEPGFNYTAAGGEGGLKWIEAGETPFPYYFLYTWADNYDGRSTDFTKGTRDVEAGTISNAIEFISLWGELPKGIGANGTGILANLYFTSKNTTAAYTPILITDAIYYTSWKKGEPDPMDPRVPNIVNGHYGTPINDVATTSVSTSPSPSATRGTVVQIEVETFNPGGYNETFTVTFSYNKTATEWESIGNYTFTLTPLESGTKKFTVEPFWDTEYVELGNYTVKAVHNLTDANSDNDNATTTIEITRPEWDVAVTAISANSEATAGDSVDINVTVANEGTKPITNVTVTVYYDGTIETQNFTDVLAYGETKDLTFEWDTTGVTPENYTIEAEATLPLLLNSTPVSERVDHNNFESTEVEIKIPDLNGNGVVDAFDLFLLSKAYGTSPTSLQQIDLYVNADDETRAAGWTRVGTNPYLNDIDYATNYVHATGGGDLVGDFGFEDSGKSMEPISNVTVQLYAQQSGKSHYLEVFVWDGSSWTTLGTQETPEDYFGWMNWTATAVLDTWTKIDGAKIYIETQNAGLYEVDCGRLQVDYVMHEPADLDYDWEVDSDDLDLFLKNYGKST